MKVLDGKRMERRWKRGGVKFDGSSASILNAESSVGQLLCATLR
jgi:hypothetical protein